MNHSIGFLMLIACFLFPVSMAFSKVKEEDIPLKGFEEFAEKVMAEWRVPGMAVGVIKDGEIVYMRGFGYRDVEKQLPVTPRTLFAIGSSTKAFTAMAVGMLVDDGKLDLDTPVIEYLPDFRLFEDYATLHTTPRDLLCHRTGMPSYDSLWFLSHGSRDEFYRRLRYLEPNHGFRDIFQYNNLMYMVAGILVGRLSGGSWEEFVVERIFKPLGMERSNFSVIDSQKANDYAKPYVTFSGKTEKVPFRNIDTTGPAGSVNSCIEDLMEWVMLHIDNGKVGDRQLISETSLAEMFLPHMTIRNPGCAKIAQSSMYGQGWYISDYRGHRLMEHGGNIDGFSAVVSFLPKEKAGVVVLTNSLNIMFYVIVRDIYDRLLGLEERDWNSHYKKVFGEIMEMFGVSGGAKEEPRPGTSPSLPLADYAGVYVHPAFGLVEVAVDNEKLTAYFQSGLTSELKHFHFDVFKGTTSDFWLPAISVSFHLSNEGTVDNLSIPLQECVSDIVFKHVKE
ncbi:MAG: serine hydrolase [Candidatus Aminicenantes bacterium]|nr:serine hydrolase [Candidatus Aminicenantes bacterium]